MKTAIKCGKLFNSNDGSILENMLIVVDGKNIAEVIPCPQNLSAEE